MGCHHERDLCPSRLVRHAGPPGNDPPYPAFVLVASAGRLLFASGAFLFLDPLATLTRSATVLFYPLGRTVRLGRPEVVPERRIGRGICENACPVPQISAVNIRAAGPEARV